MFYVSADAGGHPITCKCCSDVQPALWAVHGVLMDVDPEAAIASLKFDGDLDRYPDDPFLAIELKLAALLATTYGLKTIEVEAVIRKGLEYPFDQRNLDAALDKASVIMGQVIDDDTRYDIAVMINRLMTKGATDFANGDPEPAEDEEARNTAIPLQTEEEKNHAGLFAGLLAGAGLLTFSGGRKIIPGKGTILEGAPSSHLVMNGIVRAANYYTNRHFNEQVIPDIQNRVQALLDGTNPTDVPDVTDIIEGLGKRLKSVPYWRVVANAAASRAYHYGALKAAQMTSVTQYRLVAVLDEKTSEICIDMHDKVFWVADAVQLLEQAADADPEEVKDIMPWLRDVDGLDNDALRALGFIVPPFHGNCRTTVQFIYGGQ
jgi:hypothetical protein